MLGVSYTGRAGRRQSPVMRIAAGLVLTLTIAGCARLGLPMNEAAEGIDPMHTASLVKATVSDRVDPSDRRDWTSAFLLRDRPMRLIVRPKRPDLDP